VGTPHRTDDNRYYRNQEPPKAHDRNRPNHAQRRHCDQEYTVALYEFRSQAIGQQWLASYDRLPGHPSRLPEMARVVQRAERQIGVVLQDARVVS